MYSPIVKKGRTCLAKSTSCFLNDTGIGQVDAGVQDHHQGEKQIVDRIILGLSDQKENTGYVEEFHENRPVRDVLEFLHALEKPVHAKEIGQDLHDTDPKQAPVFRKRWNDIDGDGKRDCRQTGSQAVQRNQVGEDAVSSLPVLAHRGNLPHTHNGDTHHREQDEIIHDAVHEVADTDVGHTENPGHIRIRDQREQVVRHRQETVVEEILLNAGHRIRGLKGSAAFPGRGPT